MSSYPTRPKFFANKFSRLLAKTCAAQEIGPGACWLLTVIVGVEDAKHYSGPVTYWNNQLKPICGFGGNDRLVRARDAAVANGWLHYEPGSKSKAARYWVTIPEQFRHLDDSPTDEADDDYDDGRHPKTGRNGDDSILKQDGISNIPSRNGVKPEPNRNQSGAKPDSKRESFNPVPNPVPKQERAQGKTEKTEPTDEQIETIYAAYPRKTKKAAALKAIKKALGKFPYVELLASVRRFSECTNSVPKDERRFIPHPATWMNDERWNDDPEEWRSQYGRNGSPADSQHYDPSSECLGVRHGL